MYLSQTKLELDLTKKFDLNGQEVYLTKKVENCATQLMTCKAWETLGRDGIIYQLDYKRKKQIKEIV